MRSEQTGLRLFLKAHLVSSSSPFSLNNNYCSRSPSHLPLFLLENNTELFIIPELLLHTRTQRKTEFISFNRQMKKNVCGHLSEQQETN